MAKRRGQALRSATFRLLPVVLVAMGSPPLAGAAETTSADSAAEDCKVACGVVLGVSSMTIATGSVVTWGRITGGISTRSQGAAIWTVGLGASLAAGAGLSGDRRERAIFASGLGVLAGALTGFSVGSLADSDGESTRIAAALIGAAAGALAGGVYGALSHQSHTDASAPPASRGAPLLAVRFSF